MEGAFDRSVYYMMLILRRVWPGHMPESIRSQYLKQIWFEARVNGAPRSSKRATAGNKGEYIAGIGEGSEIIPLAALFYDRSTFLRRMLS